MGGNHGRSRTADRRSSRRRGRVHDAPLLRAGAAHRHLRAQFPRPHDLQRPDRADQKGICPQRHHHGPARGLRLRAVLFAARHSHCAGRRPAQPPQHRGAGLCVLERDDGRCAAWPPAWQRLALARIGVGIGESAGTPASQSLVADLFDKNERPRALGIYAIGTYLGVFLGYFIGGYVNQHYGWRMAFFTAGLPGIALAAVRVADGRRARARRDGGNLCARADRTDARLPRLAAKLCHRADRLLPDHLHQLRHRGLDPAVPRPRASSQQRRDRHLCRHLQGPVRDGRHAGRRPRGRADQPPRRSLEIMGAGDHLGARRARCSRCAC